MCGGLNTIKNVIRNVITRHSYVHFSFALFIQSQHATFRPFTQSLVNHQTLKHLLSAVIHPFISLMLRCTTHLHRFSPPQPGCWPSSTQHPEGSIRQCLAPGGGGVTTRESTSLMDVLPAGGQKAKDYFSFYISVIIQFVCPDRFWADYSCLICL